MVLAARRTLLLTLLGAPLSAALSGCGFHLRAARKVPYARLALVGQSGAQMDLLRRQLLAQGVQLVPPAQAEAVLTILQDAQDQTPMAYNADGTVAEYQLGLSVGYQLATPGGDLLIEPVTLRQTSFLSYSTGAALAKADESDLLYRGMEQALMMRILFQLSVEHKPAPRP